MSCWRQDKIIQKWLFQALNLIITYNRKEDFTDNTQTEKNIYRIDMNGLKESSPKNLDIFLE